MLLGLSGQPRLQSHRQQALEASVPMSPSTLSHRWLDSLICHRCIGKSFWSRLARVLGSPGRGEVGLALGRRGRLRLCNLGTSPCLSSDPPRAAIPLVSIRPSPGSQPPLVGFRVVRWLRGRCSFLLCLQATWSAKSLSPGRVGCACSVPTPRSLFSPHFFLFFFFPPG